MTTKTGKKRVRLEQDKIRRTSHWDMDYLPLEEVRKRYDRQIARHEDKGSSEHSEKRMTNRSLGLICIAAGLGLLALVVMVALFLRGGGV